MNRIKNKEFDIIFFDTPFTQLNRFCANIARELRIINPTIKIAAVVLVQAPKSNPIRMKDCPHSLLDIFDDIYLYSDIQNIDNFLINSKPKFLFFGANRIPDLEIVLHAKKIGIKTFSFQHGLYFNGCCINEFNVHNSLLAMKTMDKVWNYLTTLQRMSKYDGTSFFRVLARIFLKRGDLQALAMKSFSVPLNCDEAFIIGNYWRDYYTNIFSYDNSQLVLVGSHDLDCFNENEKIEPAICYIASTLVEEGSVTKKEFLRFIDALSETINKNTKLYIKLHPLSDRSLYEALKNHNVVFLDKQGELPPVSVYISNHSTLIGKALYYSDQLIIWQFKSEKNCFYGDYASFVCKTKSDLQNAINKISITQITHEKKPLISNIYYKNPTGAFKACALHLNTFLLNNNNKGEM